MGIGKTKAYLSAIHLFDEFRMDLFLDPPVANNQHVYHRTGNPSFSVRTNSGCRDAATKLSRTRETFKTLEQGARWLQQALEKNPTEALVKIKRTPNLFTTNEHKVSFEEVDPYLTNSPPKTAFPMEYCWDFHHEDWHQAFSLLAFAKSRRGSSVSCPFGKGKRPKRTTPAFWGYATPETQKVANEEGKTKSNGITEAELVKELLILD
ncbi:hypothetical protein BKA56DRAFT_672074 [Ilyonectria sp. MPI-CAGE-AT-0026]|nr:hypothetical protein BKA56DRAFT_672074 [Ilyonectria sp. MPI-CAGE-AT-0026]